MCVGGDVKSLLCDVVVAVYCMYVVVTLIVCVSGRGCYFIVL